MHPPFLLRPPHSPATPPPAITLVTAPPPRRGTAPGRLAATTCVLLLWLLTTPAAPAQAQQPSLPPGVTPPPAVLPTPAPALPDSPVPPGIAGDVARRAARLPLGAALVAGLVAVPGAAVQASERNGEAALTNRLAEVEAGLGGGTRLGVAVVDTGSGRCWGHRADERFPLCSTFKVMAGGAVLARTDAGQEDLTRRVRFAAAEVVTYSPVTKGRAGDGGGMTLAELCAAALTQSDNTAANLLLQSLGGPAAVTAFARSLGDDVTRLDRWETELNEAIPGDPRDTTSPAAMAANLRALVVEENHLSPRSREQLTAWLLSNQTGDARLRAGLPKGGGWRVGDKTGSGEHGTSNDVAVLWPPGERKPLIVSVYLTETTASFDARNAAIAEVGRAVHDALVAP